MPKAPKTEIITFDCLVIPHPTIFGKYIPFRIQVPKQSKESKARLKRIGHTSRKSAQRFREAMKRSTD